MISRIIVPLDGSTVSETAVPFGALLARTFAASLELFHVLEDPAIMELPPSMTLPDTDAALRYLREAARQAGFDASVATIVRTGAPVEKIVEHAASELGALVVLATHGRGGLGRLMLGSVADKVARAANVPVLLVRVTEPPMRPPRAIESVLVPLDGSPLAEKGLRLGFDLARRAGATLHLMRCVDAQMALPYAEYDPEIVAADPGQAATVMTAFEEDAGNYLAEIAEDVRDHHAQVEWMVRVGRPAEQIVAAVGDSAADVIVMATHGRGGLRRWLLGSVTSAVMHDSPVPLLVVPSHADPVVSDDPTTNS
jgi:nucleotide-binding universal stress UspA family protein